LTKIKQATKLLHGAGRL